MQPEVSFGEATLHERWLEERGDAAPADFEELQSKVDNKADSRADRLVEQMQEEQQQQTRQQQQATSSNGGESSHSSTQCCITSGAVLKSGTRAAADSPRPANRVSGGCCSGEKQVDRPQGRPLYRWLS